MYVTTVFVLLLLVTISLLETIDAHGIHHPTTHEEDPSFDNIIEQKYPTLASLDPGVVAEHRRKLAENLEHDSETDDSFICDPQCHRNAGSETWLSCDDLVRIYDFH